MSGDHDDLDFVESIINAPVSESRQGKTDIACIVAFVMAILGLLSAGMFSVFALIASIVAFIRARKFGLKGKGLATAGIIMSVIGTLFLIIFIMAMG